MLPNPASFRPSGNDDRVGFVNFWPDDDGDMRSATFFHLAEQQIDRRSSANRRSALHIAGRAGVEKLGRSADLPHDQPITCFALAQRCLRGGAALADF